jgi:hypothetical protein
MWGLDINHIMEQSLKDMVNEGFFQSEGRFMEHVTRANHELGDNEDIT